MIIHESNIIEQYVAIKIISVHFIACPQAILFVITRVTSQLELWANYGSEEEAL